jgi:hypothetical protein
MADLVEMARICGFRGQMNFGTSPRKNATIADLVEILLITDNKTVLLELGREGKFSAKSSAWEENKVLLEGEEMVIRVDHGRWFIVKRPARGAMIGPGTPAKAEAPAPETGDDV